MSGATGMAVGAGALGIIRVTTGGTSLLSGEVARIAIATGILVITLSVLYSVSPELADSLGLLMVVGAVVAPGPAGTKGAGEALTSLLPSLGRPGKPVAQVSPLNPTAPVRSGPLGG